jgi:hypothetical protein
MNDIVKQGSTALSTEYLDWAAALEAGIRKSQESTVLPGGKPILRLLKSGVWVYGANDDENQPGAELAINPRSIKHGWSCWTDYPGSQKNELKGEVMTFISAPKPAKPEPIDGFEYKPQVVFDLKYVVGDDAGLEVVYKSSSLGGLRAADNLQSALVKQIQEQVLAGTPYVVPIVQLLAADYQHTKYGQIFTPVFEIVDWANIEDANDRASTAKAKLAPATGGAAAAQPEPAPQAARARAAAPRRQRPAVVR